MSTESIPEPLALALISRIECDLAATGLILTSQQLARIKKVMALPVNVDSAGPLDYITQSLALFFTSQIARELTTQGLPLTTEQLTCVVRALAQPLDANAKENSGPSIDLAKTQFSQAFSESILSAAFPVCEGSPQRRFELRQDTATKKYTLSINTSPDEDSSGLADVNETPMFLFLQLQHSDPQELGKVAGMIALQRLQKLPELSDIYIDGAVITRNPETNNDDIAETNDESGYPDYCPICTCQAAYAQHIGASYGDSAPHSEISHLREFGHVILFKAGTTPDEVFAMNLEDGVLLKAMMVPGLFAEKPPGLGLGAKVWVMEALIAWENPKDIKAYGWYPIEGTITKFIQMPDGSPWALLNGELDEAKAIPFGSLALQTATESAPLGTHIH